MCAIFCRIKLGNKCSGKCGNILLFKCAQNSFFQFLIIVYVYLCSSAELCVINKCCINRISCFCVKVFGCGYLQFVISVYIGY